MTKFEDFKETRHMLFKRVIYNGKDCGMVFVYSTATLNGVVTKFDLKKETV